MDFLKLDGPAHCLGRDLRSLSQLVRYVMSSESFHNILLYYFCNLESRHDIHCHDIVLCSFLPLVVVT